MKPTHPDRTGPSRHLPLALVCLLLGLALSPVLAQDAPSLTAVRSSLAAKQFDGAIAAADAYIKTGPKDADEAAYLQALALYYADKAADTVKATDAFVKQFPQSSWVRKARFLNAAAYVKLNNYEGAELVYSQEANRLLSNARKHEIAGVIVGFADALAKIPDANDVGAPPPDFNKAHKLYNQVLEMEIGRDLRDEVMFKRGEVMTEAKNWGQSISDLHEYLQEFDGDWMGPVGSPQRMSRQKREQPAPGWTPGKHIFRARYLLCKSQIMTQDWVSARQNVEDLQALLIRAIEAGNADDETKTLLADTTWHGVRTWHLEAISYEELERGIKAARDFLKAYPDHRHSVEAAWLIAEAYRHHGRVDDAIAAYEDFVAAKIYKLPAGEKATEKIERLGKNATELKDEWEKLAVLYIGQLRLGQQKYAEAIAAFQRYVTRFPNGPHWAQCQQAIIDTEFMVALEAVGAKQYDKAATLFEKFLADHPLDGRAPQVLFIRGQMHFADAQKLKGDDDAVPLKDEAKQEYVKAIAEWEKLVSKYPGRDESSLALYKIGLIYEERLGELEKALDAYRRLNWGSYAGWARSRVAAMTRKHLALRTERKFRTNETASVAISLRNIEKLTVKQYTLDLEAYFRKTHSTGDIEALDISLIQPDKTWTIDVKDYAKYKPIEQTVEVDLGKDKPGVSVIHVSDEKELEASTLVIRSDLDLVFKSSRREALVFVEDMVKGQPAADVDLLISDGKQVIATGKTGKDGVWRKQLDELKDVESVRVFASRSGSVASNMVDLNGVELSSGLSPRGYIYTDRSAYQPGHLVSIRGIVRDVANGSYSAPAGESVVVSVSDPQGRLLRSEDTVLSKFGTFATSMRVDSAAPLGQYTINVRAKDKNKARLNFNGFFVVNQFQLQKVRLGIDFDQPVYYRGETVKATIKADYYWGEPVVDKPVRYTMPDGRVYTAWTDVKGEVKVEFDTTGMTPGGSGRPLPFTATVEGEDVSIASAAFLSWHGYNIEIESTDDLVLSGEPFDLKVTTKTPDGKPVGQELTLTILRRQTPKPDPVISDVPWVSLPTQPAGEVTVEEKKVTTDAKTGKATVQLKLEKGGIYVLRMSGEDRFKQVLTAEIDVTVSDDEDATKLRLFAASDTLQVGKPATVRLHSRLDKGLALVTLEGETIISHQIVNIKKGFNPLKVNVDHEHFPNFSVCVNVLDGRDLRAAQKEFTVERQLRVTIKPAQESYEPGAAGKVEIVVTDQLGRPVEAELSLAMIDEALFAIYPDNTPAILDFFQDDARRNVDFRLASTNGFRYVGRTSHVNKAILEEGERLVEAQQVAEQLDDLVASGERVDRLEVLQRQLHAVTLGGQAGGGAGRPMNGPEGRLQQAQQLALNMEESGARRPQSRAATSLFADANEPATDAPNQSSGLVALGDAQKDLGFFGRAVADFGGSQAARRELPESGRWIPSIITDVDGKATVDIEMPETTTQWRLTARGVSVVTLVGEATEKLITRKELFLSIKSPRLLNEGDKIEPLVRVHNLSDYEGAVDLVFTVTADGKTLYELRKKVDVKKQQGAEVTFDPIEAPRVRKLDLKVAATAGARSDALAREIDVQPWGMRFVDTAGGTASDDTTVFVEMPKDRKFDSQWLSILIGPDINEAVLDLAMGGVITPQPIRVGQLTGPAMIGPRPSGGYSGSELLAAVSALQYARAGKAPPLTIERLTDRARSLVSALVVTQQKDGGWQINGRIDNRESEWGPTATSYWALVSARNAGLGVNEDTLNKSREFLKGAFQRAASDDNDTKAMILHALSTAEEVDFATLNRLHRSRQTLSAPALAYTALALVNVHREQFAAEVVDVLVKQFKPTPGARKIGRWAGADRYDWLNNDVESTALALLAIVALNHGAPEADQAAQFLLQEHGCYGFPVAKVRGPVVAALSGYFGRLKLANEDYELVIRVNGKDAHTVKRNGAAGPAEATVLSVPTAMLTDGRNEVTFHLNGRGAFAYGVTLEGFSPDMSDPKSLNSPYVSGRYFYHAPLEYRGRPIGASSSSPVKNIEIGQRVRVHVSISTPYSPPRFVTIEEPLPAGMTLVEGSLSSQAAEVEVRDGRIVMQFGPGRYPSSFSYELVGYSPGAYRSGPTVVRDALDPKRMRIGQPGDLNVLGPGIRSNDPYQMNSAERFALGTAYFNDGLYKPALEHLAPLVPSKYAQRDVARMLLWIHTSEGYYDAQRIVDMFEILREKYPELYIPFDKILTVGKAYHDLSEYLQAYLVYRATIDASFLKDSNVSALLQDEGQLLGSIDYQQQLWRHYPDTSPVQTSFFALSQLLYQEAPNATRHARAERRVQVPGHAPAANGNGNAPGNGDAKDGPTKVDMLKEAVRMLETFLAHYPTSPLADDAAFSMANAYLDLKQYEVVVLLSDLYKRRYAGSEFESSFQYMQALGHFWQRDYDEALKEAKVVAEGESKDRDFARYILGQVYHARGVPADAIKWYGTVRNEYPDAGQAIDYFERKAIAIDEINIYKPDEAVDLKIEYRNIKEAAMQVYRVDLMKLYLREKNLSNITAVNLAGIAPQLVTNVALGDGKDYVDKDRKVTLNLKDEGAYLVICRGDDLFTSGLVLITPLKIEVQQDAVSGQVRANVINQVKGLRPANVHVKAIGSADAAFKSGDTDLRGLFIAEGLRGKATIIAREGDARYAFYRGDDWLGAPEQAARPRQDPGQPGAQPAAPQVDYQHNLRMQNGAIQRFNYEQFDQYRRSGQGKGVQIEATK